VLDTDSRPFRAWLSDDDEPSITADTVILATGARSMMMNVPGEERLLSHGPLDVRDVRRFLLLAVKTSPWWAAEIGDGRGVVPHTFRLERHGRAPA